MDVERDGYCLTTDIITAFAQREQTKKLERTSCTADGVLVKIQPSYIYNVNQQH